MWMVAVLAVAVSTVVAGVDFNNYTYRNTPCGNKPVTLKNGLAWYQQNENVFQVSADVLNAGSLKPGTHQAAVIVTCKYPVGSASALHVYDVLPGGVARDLGVFGTADADTGYRVDWAYTRFANNRLYIDVCDWSLEQCRFSVVTTYALRNGKLVKIYEKRHLTPRRSRSP